MKGISIFPILGFTIVWSGSCATNARSELPENTKALAICLYENLKSMPGITAVDAYVQTIPQWKGSKAPATSYAVIAYQFLSKDGKRAKSTVDLTPDEAGNKAGNFILDETGGYNDPFFKIARPLEARCNANSAYNDNAIITSLDQEKPPLQKIEMARYLNSTQP
jgi:hypothetical protein